jgi:hypothetical protein
MVLESVVRRPTYSALTRRREGSGVFVVFCSGNNQKQGQMSGCCAIFVLWSICNCRGRPRRRGESFGLGAGVPNPFYRESTTRVPHPSFEPCFPCRREQQQNQFCDNYFSTRRPRRSRADRDAEWQHSNPAQTSERQRTHSTQPYSELSHALRPITRPAPSSFADTQPHRPIHHSRKG